MRRNTRALAEIVARTMDLPEPIVEFGSYQVTGAPIENLRPLFGGKSYIGCDVRPGPGVDRIEDLERLSFADGSIGTVVLLDTLEHVQDPARAVAEVQRVLRPGGIVIATTVMDLFIHCRPDYWRFTPDAMRHIFADFGASLFGWHGNAEKPHTVFAVAVKDAARVYDAEFRAIEQAYRRAVRTWYWRIAQPYYAMRDAFAALRHNNATGFDVVVAPPDARAVERDEALVAS